MEPSTVIWGGAALTILWFITGYATAVFLKLKDIDRVFAAPALGAFPYLCLFFLHKNFGLPISTVTVLIVVWSILLIGAFSSMLKKTDEEGYIILFPEWLTKLQSFMDE